MTSTGAETQAAGAKPAAVSAASRSAAEPAVRETATKVSATTGNVPAASGWRLVGGRWLAAARRSVGWTIGLVTLPLRTYLSIRRSLTAASVAVLLAVFLTLNVIWGFPWAGMMGGCLALLVVGLAINRLMSPTLRVSVSLPRSAVAGHAFSVDVRMLNSRLVPALNLRVGWHREGVRDIYSRRSGEGWEASPPVSIDLLRSGETMHWHGAIRFDRRGVHPLPPFQITSTFPFHLFYCRKAVDTRTQIAVTPAPLSPEDDPASRVMLAAIGDWAKQLVSGAAVEYIGNREYQEGVPVRHWDFASWARLGRPIVREYQSPSVQAVTLIVDTSLTADSTAKPFGRAAARAASADDQASFERLMSLAATVIADLIGRRVQLKLFVTSESATATEAAATVQAGELRERMLVRLAVAAPIEAEIAVPQIREAIESSRSQPVLILSRLELSGRRYEALRPYLASRVTYLPVQVRPEASVVREERRFGGATT